MPQEFDNEMKGVLFKNEKKESDKHPDYKGNCQVNGVEMWLSAWIKKSKAGKPYMSLQFELKDGQSFATADVPINTTGLGEQASAIPDDDIPF